MKIVAKLETKLEALKSVKSVIRRVGGGFKGFERTPFEDR